MTGLVHSVIGVVGGSGGVGASTFAAMLAAVAGGALLMDLDAVGGGVDIVLGIEAVAGARWSGVRLAGGRLHAGDLMTALPSWRTAHVLALDGDPPSAQDVTQVLDSATSWGPVVVDLGRGDHVARQAAVLRADLLVLLAAAEVSSLAAAHSVMRALARPVDRVVLRRGSVSLADASAALGVEVVASVRGVRPGRPLRATRSMVRTAQGLLCQS